MGKILEIGKKLADLKRLRDTYTRNGLAVPTWINNEIETIEKEIADAVANATAPN